MRRARRCATQAWMQRVCVGSVRCAVAVLAVSGVCVNASVTLAASVELRQLPGTDTVVAPVFGDRFGAVTLGTTAAGPGRLIRVDRAGQVATIVDGVLGRSAAFGTDRFGTAWVRKGDNAGECRFSPTPDAWLAIAPNGAVNEFCAPRAGATTLAFNGALWTTGAQVSDFARLTPSGVAEVRSLPPDRWASSSAVAPNGAIWVAPETRDGSGFIRNATAMIGRISPNGMYGEWMLRELRGGRAVGPRSLTAAPDGSVWFTASTPSRLEAIGRFDPLTRGVTLFTRPDAPAGPAGCPWVAPSDTTATRDGSVWFVDQLCGAVGRITPSGQASACALGLSPDRRPAMLTAGHDDSVWFSTYSITGGADPAPEPAIIGRVSTGPGGCLRPISGISTTGVRPRASYVALGDSYSSGEGVPDEPGTFRLSKACHRSYLAWPMKLAELIGTTLPSKAFLACRSHTTNQLVKHQLPKLRKLGGASLITVTVGGNDMGFPDVIRSCLTRLGPCEPRFRHVQREIANFKPTLRMTYEFIKRDADGDRNRNLGGATRVIAVGYPQFFDPTRPCVGSLALPNSDKTWINARIRQFNGIAAQAAREASIRFVNPDDAFGGHRLCDGGASYFNGAMKPDEYSYHPNAAGHQAYAGAVAPIAQRP